MKHNWHNQKFHRLFHRLFHRMIRVSIAMRCSALLTGLKNITSIFRLAVEAWKASASLTSYNNPQADFTKPATAEESCGRKAKSNT